MLVKGGEKMKLKVSVFEYLNQKVMYVQDVNYYFGIKNDFNIKLGDYELSKDQILAIAKENDPEEYEVFVSTSIEERLNKIKTYDIEEIKEQSSYTIFSRGCLRDYFLYQEGILVISTQQKIIQAL